MVDNQPHDTDAAASISAGGPKTLEHVSLMRWMHRVQATQLEGLQAAMKEPAGCN